MTERNSTRAPALNQAKKKDPRTKTTATFVEQAKAVHQDKFIYDAVNYVNGKQKVIIGCRVHGDFHQTPSAHLRGQGCPTCARLITSKKKTKAEFIADANAVHGKGRYDYSKAVYKGNKVKVEIICNQCNESFWQKPNGHITNKSGCPKCVFKSTWVTQDDFIERCIKAHGDSAYDYSKAVYTRGCDKVTIGCNTCGEWFEQRASKHMKGGRCSHCFPIGRDRMTQAEFLDRCYAIYGFGAYDYSQTKYVTADKRVKVFCNTCNKFFTRQAHRHVTGGGCTHCIAELKGLTRTKFVERCKYNNKEGNGRLYAIECFGSGEKFYKVGITSHRISHRLKGRKALPYKHKVLFEIEAAPDYVFDLETRLHRMLKGFKYEPSKFFTGRTECFTTIKPVEKLLKELTTTEQLQLLA